jgi:glycosyltransferase involved in cell wall biosynthesis
MLHKSGVTNFEVVFAGDFMMSPDDPDDVIMYQERFLQVVNDTENSFLKYVGTISGTSKELALNIADVLVLPTNYHVEGQPVSIIEAMAYSCAIIATDYRSIPDLVDITNSKFVEFSNVKELADVMKSLIDDRFELESMCKWSSERFIKNFTWDCHYRKMHKVIIG